MKGYGWSHVHPWVSLNDMGDLMHTNNYHKTNWVVSCTSTLKKRYGWLKNTIGYNETTCVRSFTPKSIMKRYGCSHAYLWVTFNDTGVLMNIRETKWLLSCTPMSIMKPCGWYYLHSKVSWNDMVDLVHNNEWHKTTWVVLCTLWFDIDCLMYTHSYHETKWVVSFTSNSILKRFGWSHAHQVVS